MIDRDGDRSVLEVLTEHGSDLTKPAHTIHFFYFKSEASAESAAAELQAEGYEKICVHRAPAKNFWEKIFGSKEFSCIAETHAVKLEAEVFATSDRMNALAEKYGGDYDGWECSIEK